MKFKSASSNPRVTSSNPWVTSSNLRATSSNPRIIKSTKTQVNSLKISSFPNIINPKLFGWVSKHQLWKKRPKFSTEKLPGFLFPIFNTKPYAVPFNYYCQPLKVPPRRINGGLSDNGCSCICLVSFLIFSLIKQPYSEVGNSRMYRYGNAIAALFLLELNFS